MRILAGYKTKSDVEYTPFETIKYQRRVTKYSPDWTSRLKNSIQNTVNSLCTVSDSDVLIGKYNFHKLNNYSISVDGYRYTDVYDVHVPTGGSNNNNDLVILFAYDHELGQIILLDIGSHAQLNISGTREYDTPLVIM